MLLNDVCKVFRENDKFLICTHEAPDGDGLGAEYALCSTLLDLNKEALILNADPMPPKYHFIDKRGIIKSINIDGKYPRNLKDWTLVILDTNLSNIGPLVDISTSKETLNTVIIDHHVVSGELGYSAWLNPDSSSTCEMVFDLIEAMNIRITLDIAVALYTGIVYDTGSFAYPKTQARTFEIAEILVRNGAIPNEIFSQLYARRSKASLTLQTMVMSTLRLYHNDHVAIQLMSRETLITSGAHYEEAQEIVNYPLQCFCVQVSIFLKENEKGRKRCSIRSKGTVDCVSIAQPYRGGGHKTASGFQVKKPFEEIQLELLELLRPYFT